MRFVCFETGSTTRLGSNVGLSAYVMVNDISVELKAGKQLKKPQTKKEGNDGGKEEEHGGGGGEANELKGCIFWQLPPM